MPLGTVIMDPLRMQAGKIAHNSGISIGTNLKNGSYNLAVTIAPFN